MKDICPICDKEILDENCRKDTLESGVGCSLVLEDEIVCYDKNHYYECLFAYGSTRTIINKFEIIDSCNDDIETKILNQNKHDKYIKKARKRYKIRVYLSKIFKFVR